MNYVFLFLYFILIYNGCFAYNEVDYLHAILIMNVVILPYYHVNYVVIILLVIFLFIIFLELLVIFYVCLLIFLFICGGMFFGFMGNRLRLSCLTLVILHLLDLKSKDGFELSILMVSFLGLKSRDL